MPIISDGTYIIKKPNDQAAGVFMTEAPPPPNSLVFVLPIGPGDESKWFVLNLSNGNIIIENLATKNFLGYLGEPKVNTPCEQTSPRIEWRIQPTGEQGKYHVVVPGGPVDGTELAFDRSLFKTSPPQTALRPLCLEDVDQAWGFILQQ